MNVMKISRLHQLFGFFDIHSPTVRNMSSLKNKFNLPSRYSASESNVWYVFIL